MVDTGIQNLTALSEKQAQDLARPVALYAVQKGYLDRARKLQIDGRSYALDQFVGVTLVHGDDGYRAVFNLAELGNGL